MTDRRLARRVEHGAKAVICASTGNTSASAAAYATHAGITAAVLVPEGKIAMGKLSQAIAHNGQLIQIRGNFDDCLEIARELADELPGAPRELGQPRPHRGAEDGGLRGRRGARRRARLPLHPGRQRRQLHRLLRAATAKRPTRGVATRVPRMFGFQAEGSRPARARRDREATPRRSPARSASATRPRGSSPSRRATRPTATSARSTTTGSSRRRAPRRPRSASSSSPPRRSASRASSSAPRPASCPKGARVVLTVTGHGLKDPQWALRNGRRLRGAAHGRAPSTTAEVASVLGLAPSTATA